VDDLVTCWLTACTPCTPGTTLGNEYGKTLPFTLPSNLRRYCIKVYQICNDAEDHWQYIAVNLFYDIPIRF